MRLLVWGDQPGPVPYFRGGQMAPYWAEHGIEAAYIPLDRFWPGIAEHADVAFFRRWYVDQGQTAMAWDTAGKSRVARIYDADDWDPGIRPDNTYFRHTRDQLGLIARMAREADLVTTTTPHLASLLRRFNPRVRIIRNAVEADLYRPTVPRTDDRVTALYYGSWERLREYFGAPDDRGRWRGGYAAAAVKAARLRAVWLGLDGGWPRPVEFETVIPYDHDFGSFCRSLGNVHADIGVAPLVGDSFDRSKSELHWLELTAAGVAVVAERQPPYSVVRDGVDGLLARGAQEWHDAVKRLRDEPNLRADLVAAARERLVTEYDPRQRAGEWADAFRTALELRAAA